MSQHHFVYLSEEELSASRNRWRQGDSSLDRAVADLALEADKLMGLPPTSVLDKTGIADSGDRQDFYAIGGYSWPNTATLDGLPYQYRDSQTNPEALSSDEFDKGRYEEMTRRVAVLALAYFYSSDKRYAAHCTEVLRAWFIDPSTRMNPHFRYAAARPGVWDGHFSGAIEGVYLIEMLDFVGLLEDSSEWTDADDRALRDWFLSLSEWLAHSRFGRRELYSPNNHGSYILAQIMCFATYGGNSDRARRAVAIARGQLRRQIRPDGAMPLEIFRADAWFYSVYGLRAFVILARMAERYGEDLWAEAQTRIAQGCVSLAPYLTGREPWAFSRESKPWVHDAVQTYHVAARAYSSQELRETAMEIKRQEASSLPDVALLGLADNTGTREPLTLPVAKSWPSSLAAKPGGSQKVEALAWRVFGVLAARGVWPGRHLP